MLERVTERQTRIGLAAVMLAYIGIVWPSLSAPFFPLDDLEQIHHIRAATHWQELLTRDFYGFFRPVKNLLFLLFIPLAEHGMIWPRLIAVAVGLLAIGAVYQFSRQLWSAPAIALLATAVWALAPTLVSSTAWLSCVNIMLMTASACLGLTLHQWAATSGRSASQTIQRGSLALLLFLFAILAYEGGISVLAIVFMLDAMRQPHRFRERRLWPVYGGYVVLGVVYMAVRVRMQSGISLIASFSQTSPLEAVGASAWFTWQHFFTWWAPFGRFAIIGGHIHPQMATGLILFGWLFVVALVAGIFWCWRRQPLISIGLAWFLLGFAPMSNIAGFRNGPWGDYYITLASVGLAILVAECVRLWASSRRPLLLVAVFMLLGLRVAGAVEAVRWSAIWTQPHAVYTRTVATFPQAFDAWLELAKLEIDQGRPEQGLEWALRAHQLAPDRHRPLPVLAMAHLRLGNTTAARELVTTYLVDHPNDPWALGFLGFIVETVDQNPDEAFALYQRAVEQHPWEMDSLYAANRLAFLHVDAEEYDQALELWTAMLRFRPDDRQTHHNLAITYRRLGRQEEFRYHAERAHALQEQATP